MRRALLISISVLLAAGVTQGQQTTAAAPAPAEEAQPDQVKFVPIVFLPGPGVTAPEPLPSSMPFIPPKKCKGKTGGVVVLSFFVDTAGRPQKITLIQPATWQLDQLASRRVAEERFKPGTHDGVPAAVAQSVEVDLQACNEETKDDAGEEAHQLRPLSQPVQKYGAIPLTPEDFFGIPGMKVPDDAGGGGSGLCRVGRGGGVTAPFPMNSVEAVFSEEAKGAKFQGVCILSLVVDAQGMPQHVHVIRSLGMGLDEKAIEAARKYRFKPAMKDGRPVPVAINVEVIFRLY